MTSLPNSALVITVPVSNRDDCALTWCSAEAVMMMIHPLVICKWNFEFEKQFIVCCSSNRNLGWSLMYEWTRNCARNPRTVLRKICSIWWMLLNLAGHWKIFVKRVNSRFLKSGEEERLGKCIASPSLQELLYFPTFLLAFICTRPTWFLIV